MYKTLFLNLRNLIETGEKHAITRPRVQIILTNGFGGILQYLPGGPKKRKQLNGNSYSTAFVFLDHPVVIPCLSHLKFLSGLTFSTSLHRCWLKRKLLNRRPHTRTRRTSSRCKSGKRKHESVCVCLCVLLHVCFSLCQSACVCVWIM